LDRRVLGFRGRQGASVTGLAHRLRCVVVGDEAHRLAAKCCPSPRRPRHGDSAPVEFLVFEGDEGDYRWRLVAGDGATHAQGCKTQTRMVVLVAAR
jgi:hypothetical protein